MREMLGFAEDDTPLIIMIVSRIKEEARLWYFAGSKALSLLMSRE